MAIDAQRKPNSEVMRSGGWWHKILDEPFFDMLKKVHLQVQGQKVWINKSMTEDPKGK